MAINKRRRKEIKQKVLNYYREKANQNWDMGLADYLSCSGLSVAEVDYGCIIARKFIDRVQTEPLKTPEEIMQDLLDELGIE